METGCDADRRVVVVLVVVTAMEFDVLHAREWVVVAPGEDHLEVRTDADHIENIWTRLERRIGRTPMSVVDEAAVE